MKVVCLNCKKVFSEKPSRIAQGKGKYCCIECFHKAQGCDSSMNCEHCGKAFHVGYAKINSGERRFCSRACYDTVRTNKIGTRIEQAGKAINDPRNKDSYVFIYVPDHPRNKKGMIAEHIVVVERLIGRRLTVREAVHHINGVKYDNSPENLYVFPNNGKHTQYHHWLRESYCKPIMTSNIVDGVLNYSVLPTDDTRGVERVCAHCDKTFIPKRMTKDTYCSPECYKLAQGMLPPEPCEVCGKLVKRAPAFRKKRIFCSQECYFESRRQPKPNTQCEYCGKPIKKPPKLLKANRKHYCGRECMGLDRRGKSTK